MKGVIVAKGARPPKAGGKSKSRRRNLRHTVATPGVTYPRVLPENVAEERAMQIRTGGRW